MQQADALGHRREADSAKAGDSGTSAPSQRALRLSGAAPSRRDRPNSRIIERTLILIAVLYTFISLPFVIREVAPVLSQVSSDQESAAHTIGASGWQTFWHVTLPAIRWGLLYGMSLTFARAVGEIGAVLVVSGGVRGLTETSTLFIFRSLDDRNYVGANAMSVILAGLSFVILIVIEFFKKRAEEH